jgi:carbamoyl-phosphate synthase large subunit
MSELNILLLSAGRRVELIQCFQLAAKRLNIKSKIVAGDCSESAPAIYMADCHYILPRIISTEYIPSIIEVCNKENIALIVPTNDNELLILAIMKDEIEVKTSAKVLISDFKTVELCRNKVLSHQFFKDNGFGVPKIITDKDIASDNYEFPLFIKPIDGSSSINAFKVNNTVELEFFRNYIDRPMIQSFMSGIEYTVDCFLDFESNIISIVPRQRMETRAGEISKGKIIKNQLIIRDVTRLMEVLKPIGHITVQCMKSDNDIKYIEINPRFGGGAPMSIRAGADSCEYLYRLLLDEELGYRDDYIDNAIILRFDHSIMLDQNMEIIYD